MASSALQLSAVAIASAFALSRVTNDSIWFGALAAFVISVAALIVKFSASKDNGAPPKEEMTKKMREFLEKPQLSGDLAEVPGLGKPSIEKLGSKGIKTTYQLLGYFLKQGRNEEVMSDFLCTLDRRLKKHNMKETAKALRLRVADKGVKCNIKLSDHVVKTTVTKFGNDKKNAFLQRKLNGTLSDDFFGISDETKFNDAGIQTTDHLFGEFLLILSKPNMTDNIGACDAFYDKLKGIAAPGFKSPIIYQLQAKLSVGIDKHGPNALMSDLEALPEVSEDALDEDAYDAQSAGSPAKGRAPTTAPTPTRTGDGTRHRAAVART